MPTATLLTRDDTLLGICQGLGEDLGVNPNYLRIALAAVVLVAPLAAIGIYLVLGIVLAIARWGWPATQAAPTATVALETEAKVASNDDQAALAHAA